MAQDSRQSNRPFAKEGLRESDPVTELSVFCKVKPGREQAIREVFNQSPEEQAPALKAVKDVGTVHNARYVLFDNGTRLMFATTFDGDWDVYIDDFAASIRPRRLGHNSSSIARGTRTRGRRRLTVDEIKEFLTANQVTAADFYMRLPRGYDAGDREGAARAGGLPAGAGRPRAPPRRSSTRRSSRCWSRRPTEPDAVPRAGDDRPADRENRRVQHRRGSPHDRGADRHLELDDIQAAALHAPPHPYAGAVICSCASTTGAPAGSCCAA